MALRCLVCGQTGARTESRLVGASNLQLNNRIQLDSLERRKISLLVWLSNQADRSFYAEIKFWIRIQIQIDQITISQNDRYHHNRLLYSVHLSCSELGSCNKAAQVEPMHVDLWAEDPCGSDKSREKAGRFRELHSSLIEADRPSLD